MKFQRLLTSFTLCFAFCVILLGAYTRLTDAGLGCPDWPGCYGHFIKINNIQGWTEMVHRYAAGTLSVCLLTIAFLAYRHRKTNPHLTLPFVLLAILGFQAVLGMWTVTLKLLPIVVMGHLLGGLSIISLLTYYRWQLSAEKTVNHDKYAPHLIKIGVILLIFQIALGGWVSSNYAGIACMGFPTCNGHWIPALDPKHAFQLFTGFGANHQGGLLEPSARVTIQFFHRVGAVIVVSYCFMLSMYLLFRNKNPRIKQLVCLLLVALGLQFILGVLNVILLLPLPVAVAHNGVAVILLMTLVSLLYLKGNYHD